MADDKDNSAAMGRSPTVSAIVVSYFTGPLLVRCLSSLASQKAISEIILADNGNPSSDIEAAKEAAGEIATSVLSGHGNIGFAAACNLAAKRACGDMLFFINPDAIAPDGGVSAMVEAGVGLSRPWLMGAKLVGPDGIEQQGSRRETLTPWRAFVEATRLYKLAPGHPYFRRFNLHADAAPAELKQVPTISGACFFLWAEDYEAIGGMDEHYFLHVEDVDFCLRFAKGGGSIYFNPHVEIVHFKSSSRANPVKIEARKTASMIRYFNTHFSDAYPKPFLWIVAGLLWALFGVLFVKRAIGKMLRLTILRFRIGRRGVERARAIFSRRSSR